MTDNRQRLLGMTLDELKAVVAGLGMPAFTARQIARWLYVSRVRCIDDMTDISKANREILNSRFTVGLRSAVGSQTSSDGTEKYLFPAATTHEADEERFVETVYIPDADRATLCVSCQVGCKMNCLFCQTGKQGWQGNLTAADIMNQLHAVPHSDRLTNVVFMGQGEPMDNLDVVLKVCEILTAPWGWQWSPKRITVSSVGVKGKLKRFLDESSCHVAVSLHSPEHEQRLQLMPAERAMPIAETVALLRGYDFSHQRRCSFEYICFGGLNDSLAHGRQIASLLQGLECRVNLIRYHRIPAVSLPSSEERNMEALRDYLNRHGITTTIRASRGQDILAACGMLSTAKSQN